MALRVASLDYLGTVASRLRKDALSSRMDQRTIDRILKEVHQLSEWINTCKFTEFQYVFIMLLAYLFLYRLQAVMRYSNSKRLCWTF